MLPIHELDGSVVAPLGEPTLLPPLGEDVGRGEVVVTDPLPPVVLALLPLAALPSPVTTVGADWLLLAIPLQLPNSAVSLLLYLPLSRLLTYNLRIYRSLHQMCQYTAPRIPNCRRLEVRRGCVITVLES